MDPCDLPLVPPMDHNASMSGIDKISPLPMRINTENGVGFFGSRRRDEGSPFIRFHAGVDLLAPVNTPVHPVMGGEVVWSKRGSVHLLHDNGVRYLTVYNHLNEIEPNVQVGQFVGTSNPLGKSGDPTGSPPHLHFEIRYIFWEAKNTRATAWPVDPTQALFAWEEKSYRNRSEVDWPGHVVDNAQIASIEVIRRSRFLRFMMIRLKGVSQIVYLPLMWPSPFWDEMAAIIKESFYSGNRVRIVWRDSIFFDPIKSIVAEVKAYSK